MIGTLVLLCLAAPAFSWWDTDWKVGLKVRYDVNPLSSVTGKSFIDLPQTKAAALKNKWEETEKPDLHEGFESLEVLCHKQYSICLLVDDNEFTAGILITFNLEEFTKVKYDWTIQGYKDWTRTDENGDSEHYKYTALYFSCPEYLEISAEDRLATRNPKKLLQDNHICVSGINGELHPISTDPEEIADTTTSNFTLQACMPWMGTHYYYQMSSELACDDYLFPWFPLVHGGQLVGIGAVTYGQLKLKGKRISTFEVPPKAAVKIIVPRGPECLYELADNPGLVTMHTYFMDKPMSILCLPELG